MQCNLHFAVASMACKRIPCASGQTCVEHGWVTELREDAAKVHQNFESSLGSQRPSEYEPYMQCESTSVLAIRACVHAACTAMRFDGTPKQDTHLHTGRVVYAPLK